MVTALQGHVSTGSDPRRRVTHLSASALVAVAAVAAFAVEAQPAGAQPVTNIAKIGYLTGDTATVDEPRRNAFKQGLRDLGYIEGTNIFLEYRLAGGESQKLPVMMAELLRLKVDLVFAFTTPAIQAAKNATKGTSVPVVFAAHNPEELGVVASLARPGGNMTGLTLSAGPQIFGKYVELLRGIVPRLSRVATLSNPLNPLAALQSKETQSAAAALGVTLLPFNAKAPDDLEAAFAAITEKRAEALVVFADAMLLGERRRIADLCVKATLPSMYAVLEHTEAGGLMAYATDRLDIFRRAATYVDKILKGAKPADLPVEQPLKFDLVINLKTAKALGLTVSPSMLSRADRIID